MALYIAAQVAKAEKSKIKCGITSKEHYTTYNIAMSNLSILSSRILHLTSAFNCTKQCCIVCKFKV